MAQRVKNLPEMQEIQVQEDPLKKGMATNSNILAWRFPWTEEPGGCSPWGPKESDTAEQLTFHLHELDGPLHFSSLWNLSLDQARLFVFSKHRYTFDSISTWNTLFFSNFWYNCVYFISPIWYAMKIFLLCVWERGLLFWSLSSCVTVSLHYGDWSACFNCISCT